MLSRALERPAPARPWWVARRGARESGRASTATLREFKDSLAHSDDEAPEDAERITA